MQVNSICSNCCPKPHKLGFGGAQRVTQVAKDVLPQEVLRTLTELRSDMLRATYSGAIDHRMRIFQEAQSKFDFLKHVLEGIPKA